MKFTIKHEKKGRIRVHLFQKYMNFTQADTLQYYLENLDGVKKAQVFNRTSDALIYYTGERNELLKAIQAFGYSRVSVPAQVLENSGRELNETYKEKLVNKVIFHYGRKLLLPYPLSAIYTTAMSVKYIWLGVKTLWKRKIEVPVLDATAIGVSIFRGDFSTAGSVMFLLGIGELLEEWTHKKSVDDLARTMSLNTGKVWLRSEGTEVLVDADKIQAGDMVVVHMGNVVPFDGLIAEGEAMVNQASLTGESVPVRKVEGNSVYAGTVVEEGEAVITVKAVGGSSRYEKIAAMIEDTEKLKSGLESKAEWIFTGRDSVGALWQVENKYTLLGGIIGAFITITVIQSMGSLGPAKAAMLIVISQLAVAYIIELFGLFGVEKVDFQWRKLIGMAVAIVGIVIFKWEK